MKLIKGNPEPEEFLQRVKDLIDPKLDQILREDTDSHREIFPYQINTGGKRLRPAIAILTCQSLRGNKKDVIFPACGLEILHNYLLIIDDIIDKGELRRGQPTTWKKFGKSIAKCAGVGYSATLVKLAANSNHPQKIANLFSRTLKRITEGEIDDILFEQGTKENEPYIEKTRPKKITKENYLKMIENKTASLFEASFETGGICANAADKTIKKLKKAGYNLGMAFQIQDDILDIFGKQEKFGKEIGKDIREKKRGNILILLAGKEDPQIMSLLEKASKKETKQVKKIVTKIKDTKALKKAKKLNRDYQKEAKKLVTSLPSNKAQTAFLKIIEFLENRTK